MKTLTFLTVLFLSTSGFAQITSPEVCASQMKSNHPIFQTALNNLTSFTYVRKALETALKNLTAPQLCVSMLALSNNQYHYYQYFIQVSVQSGTLAPAHRFQFLFQDASVQAFHNVGGQPWTGLDLRAVQAISDRMINGAQFSEVAIENKTTWVALAQTSKTFQRNKDHIDLQTLSAAPLFTASSTEPTILVTWMTKANANPFLNSTMVQGILLRTKGNGSIEMAENIAPAGDLLFPLDENARELRKTVSENHEEWIQKLLQISLL